MTRMKMLAWSVRMVLASVAPAAADSPATAPSSLRMRPRIERRWFAPHWHKRVAQASPDQPATDPPADGTAPAGPAADPSAAAAPEASSFTGGSPHGDGFTYDASFVTSHTSAR